MTTSPLDQFEVNTLLSISAPILNLGIYLTNISLYTLIVLILLISMFTYASITADSTQLVVPTNRWSVGIESLYASIQGMVSDQIGDAQTQYIPFIISIFTFILIANLVGNIPYSFSMYTSIILTIFMSITIFLGVTLLGLKIHKIHWFSFFLPNGTPIALAPLLVLIETISYLARAVSLAVRLSANVIAGKILAYIVSSGLYGGFSAKGPLFLYSILTLIPTLIFIALLGLELGVAIIQAYVFTILTCSYINDAIKLH